MARAKARLELTLFPFLSVLAGMIAVMMLFMMITLGTRVIGDDSKGQRTSAEPPPPKSDLFDEAAADDAEGIDEARWLELQQEIAKLSADLVQRHHQYQELERTVQQLETLIEVKKNEVEIAPATQAKPGKILGEPTQVDVVPAKGDFKFVKKPHYVEVTAGGYVLYPDKALFPPVERKRMAGGDMFNVDPKLEQFLDSVNAKRKKEFIVFLIHPSGTTAFNDMLQYIDRRYPIVNNPADEFDTGWEPFPKGWTYVPGKR